MKLPIAICAALGLALAPASHAADPIVAAAGDIACDPSDPNYAVGIQVIYSDSSAGQGPSTWSGTRETEPFIVREPGPPWPGNPGLQETREAPQCAF